MIIRVLLILVVRKVTLMRLRCNQEIGFSMSALHNQTDFRASHARWNHLVPFVSLIG